MLQVADAEKQVQLSLIRDNLLSGYTLHLYKNSVPIDHATVVGDFAESTFAGYSPIPLTTWSSTSLTADFHALISEQIRVFTCSTTGTPEDVYGYYVTNSGGDLAFSEANPAGPTTIASAGDTYVVLPRYTLDSENEVI